MRTKKITQIGLITVLILGFVGYGFAQTEKGKEGKEEPKKITVEKTVSGEVSGISSNFIGSIPICSNPVCAHDDHINVALLHEVRARAI